jgi:pimeloyl-ACP methyl ester carboxylesterase
MFRKRFAAAMLLPAVLLWAGCAGPDRLRDNFGKTYYIDGAGNWGFGVTEVARALNDAGYKGSVEAYMWTTSFNPAIDQVNRPAAHLRAAALTGKIHDYLKEYPDNDVNIISLSAGTGVGTWAVEALPNGVKINNMVLLGSSLSSTYNMTRTLEHMKGRVYVFYSSYDPILGGPVKVLGTIDGSMDDAAGLVGLQPRPGQQGRIVNIPWRPEYAEYGWAGGHTDSTSEPFVQRFVAPYITANQVRPAAQPVSATVRQQVARPPKATDKPIARPAS